MNHYSKSLDYLGTGVEYAQTIGFAYVAKELAKLCVSRPRPYMYFDNAPQNKIHEGDWDDSGFYCPCICSFWPNPADKASFNS